MKNQRKNKKARRTLLLLLLICITGTLLTTASYAWFTANRQVSVNTITVNVAAKNGIQISVDGTDWKSIIQTDDIRAAHTAYVTASKSANMLPTSMEPVSTIGEVENDSTLGNLIKMFYGTVSSNAGGDNILSATRVTEARDVATTNNTAKFVAFDIFLKVTETTDLYITSDSGVSANGTDKGIKNATRFAFLLKGNTTTESTLQQIQELNSDNTVYIWEPNYDVHTASGIANARDIYGLTTTATGATQLSYFGVKAPIADSNNVLLSEANTTAGQCFVGGVVNRTYADASACSGASGTWVANSTYFGAVSPDYSTTAANANNFQVFGLSAGITKLRVYMWVEGQDVDCENEASGSDIDFDLAFTIPEPQP